MTKQNLTNYYQELFQYFQVFGTMLDIGCNGLDYLFQFDNSKFKRLIGIDINIPLDPFVNYYNFKNSSTLESKFDYDYLEKRFLQKYRFFNNSILDFNVKKDYYGFIFCKHVIHFIPHDKQLQLIDNLFLGLKKNGLLFLKVNHNLNNDYRINISGNELTNNYFIDKKKGITHYPCDSDVYIKHLTNKYKIELLTNDDKSITTLIRKINNC